MHGRSLATSADVPFALLRGTTCNVAQPGSFSAIRQTRFYSVCSAPLKGLTVQPSREAW